MEEELEELRQDEMQQDIVADSQNNGDKKPFKREWGRFEFALFINDFLICKRNFPINGYVEKSMQTQEFKNEVDKIVEIIDEDLKSKSRIYTWHHNWSEQPDWEPEMFTEPLIDEGEFVLKFTVYDNGEEVISKQWDARYYPSYVRKGIDLTNRQVKITKDDKTNIYDKDKFFGDHGSQLSGDLYVLMHMISDKENLVPIIQKCIYEVCSSFDGYYEKSSDYHTVVEYKNTTIKKDENGNAMYRQLTYVDNDGNEIGVCDAFGNPWMVPVFEKSDIKGKKYNLNIDAANMKYQSAWGLAVLEKTKKYMRDLYVNPKEKYFKKKVDA